MTTQKQAEANRLNAQKSTGPRSDEGKARSAMNALKSGLDAESQFVQGESPAEFAKLQAEYFDYYTPNNPEARFYLDNAIRNEWLLRRFHRVEAQLWKFQTDQVDRSSPVTPHLTASSLASEQVAAPQAQCRPARGQLGEALSKSDTHFMRLHRRVVAAEKAFKSSMTEFKKLQAEAPPAKPAPQTQQTKPETQQLASFRTPPPEPPATPMTDAEFAQYEQNLMRELADLGLLDDES
jgi:hypothetical protein